MHLKSHEARGTELVILIERTQQKLKKAVWEHYISHGDLYLGILEPIVGTFECAIRNRQCYDVPHSTITDWHIFRKCITNYCRYLMESYKMRWYLKLHMADHMRRYLYLSNLQRAIYVLENHYIHGVD